MFFSAIEVFPKECMGCLCCRNKNIVEVAIPYQKARRQLEEVMSTSSSFFDSILDGRLKKTGDYHSHTKTLKRELPQPSSTDIKELEIGGIEFIVQIRRTRAGNRKHIQNSTGGTINIAWGHYRGLVAAFVRRKSPSGDKKTPYYQQVRLEMD